MIKLIANQGDDELLRLMLAGDAESFETLYERRQAGVYRFALRMSGSESIAEDVTQDVFIALLRDGGQYDSSRGSLAAYLYGMARHRVLRRLERDRSFVSISDEVEEDDPTMSEKFINRQDPLAELTRNEIIDSVRQAILALPAHYREVVVLCNLQELNYEDAANIIGCPVGTVRSRLHRARTMLIEKLQTIKKAEAPPRNLLSARCV
ncbi:MAG: RNA polymerase sigma factor [Acidobacteria bacterium]|nr:RNA polymerase sigma factor [Acidobacteriota bacterium]